MKKDIFHIIGIDCATVSGKRGVAVAMWNDECIVKTAKVGSSDADIIDIVRGCIQYGGRTLLALDAPLGWPEPLGRSLIGHRAGEHIDTSAHDLFRRETDRFVKKVYNLQPLDVGADRIARTAHTALNLLHTVRQKTGEVVTCRCQFLHPIKYQILAPQPLS